MKKRFFYLLLLSIAYSSLLAQTDTTQTYHEFAPIGAKWYYTIKNSDCADSYVKFEVTKDTIIQDKLCKLITSKIGNSEAILHYGYHHLLDTIIIHQNKHRIFSLNPLENTFNLVFDFGVEQNDTMTLHFVTGCTADFLALDVELIEINGQQLKQITFQEIIDHNYKSMFTVTEKIAGMRSLLPDMFDDRCDGSQQVFHRCVQRGLRCYEDNEFGHYQTDEVNGVCDEITSIEEQNVESINIQLLSSLNLLINIPNTYNYQQTVTVQLFNLQGIKVFEQQIPIGKNMVQLPIDLDEYIYIVCLKNDKNNIFCNKIFMS